LSGQVSNGFLLNFVIIQDARDCSQVTPMLCNQRVCRSILLIGSRNSRGPEILLRPLCFVLPPSCVQARYEQEQAGSAFGDGAVAQHASCPVSSNPGMFESS
jgi:hypothetical protein